MSEQNKPILIEGMETLEQITERATREAKTITDGLPGPSGSISRLWNTGFETGYTQGVISEATRNEQARTKDRELIQTLTNSIGKFLDMANDGDVVVYHLEDDQPPPTEQLESALAIAGEQGHKPTPTLGPNE
jgi:hypothetical protein